MMRIETLTILTIIMSNLNTYTGATNPLFPSQIHIVRAVCVSWFWCGPFMMAAIIGVFHNIITVFICCFFCNDFLRKSINQCVYFCNSTARECVTDFSEKIEDSFFFIYGIKTNCMFFI